MKWSISFYSIQQMSLEELSRRAQSFSRAETGDIETTLTDVNTLEHKSDTIDRNRIKKPDCYNYMRLRRPQPLWRQEKEAAFWQWRFTFMLRHFRINVIIFTITSLLSTYVDILTYCDPLLPQKSPSLCLDSERGYPIVKVRLAGQGLVAMIFVLVSYSKLLTPAHYEKVTTIGFTSLGWVSV
jgi:hypothetical protein